MNIRDIVKNRRSVRTFDGTPLDSRETELLLDFAKKADNPFGLPIEWRLLSAKENGLSSQVVVGAETYIAGKMERVPHAEEAFGYSFERILLYAESLGISGTIIAGTMDRPAFERAMALGEGEVMPCISPLGRPAKKMSLRETMMRRGIKADSRMRFEELFFDGSFENALTPENAGSLRAPLEAVRLAPSAVNRQPWRVVLAGDRAHFYEKRSKGFVSADGWDTQKIDLGIAMCHFAGVLEELGVGASFELGDPGLETPQDTAYIASYRIKR